MNKKNSKMTIPLSTDQLNFHRLLSDLISLPLPLNNQVAEFCVSNSFSFSTSLQNVSEIQTFLFLKFS